MALAMHADADIRLEVAVALPAAMTNDPNPAGVEALVRLSADPDPGNRNWAVFGLGPQVEADGPQIRDTLWTCVKDEDADVRGEGICGLARRHDLRAVPLVAELLTNGEVHDWVFNAAASLADASFVPLPRRYGKSDGVTRAIARCDPGIRRRRVEAYAEFLRHVQTALDERRPSTAAALFSDLWDDDSPLLTIDGADELVWFVDTILDLEGGDPRAAAGRVIGQLQPPPNPD